MGCAHNGLTHLASTVETHTDRSRRILYPHNEELNAPSASREEYSVLHTVHTSVHTCRRRHAILTQNPPGTSMERRVASACRMSASVTSASVDCCGSCTGSSGDSRRMIQSTPYPVALFCSSPSMNFTQKWDLAVLVFLFTCVRVHVRVRGRACACVRACACGRARAHTRDLALALGRLCVLEYLSNEPLRHAVLERKETRDVDVAAAEASRILVVGAHSLCLLELDDLAGREVTALVRREEFLG